METYIETLNKLKSSSKTERLSAAEFLLDLYEEKFVYISPPKELLNEIVSSLIDSILKETDYETQLEQFTALYQYCWYRSDRDYMYKKLMDNFDGLLDANCRQYVVRIFIASGDRSNLELYQNLLNHHENPVRVAAKEGIESIS